MGKPTFSVTRKDAATVALMNETPHKALGVWARDCAVRVLPYFDAQHPDDYRPRQAIEVLQAWLDSGVFSMAVIRKASLDAHAAARDVGIDNPARSAARATGQAVATAHVPTHAIGATNYALQAVHRAAQADEADAAVAAERAWQVQRLLDLGQHNKTG